MEYVKDKGYSIRFKITVEKINEIYKLFCEFAQDNNNKINFTIGLLDGTRYYFTDIESLYALPNRKTNPIELIIISYKHEYSVLELSFRDSDYQSVHYRINCFKEEKFTHFDTQIINYIQSIKLKGSFFHESFAKGILFTFLFVIPFSVSLNTVIMKFVSKQPDSFYLFISIIFSVSGVLLLSYTQKKFFHTGNFLLGDGLQRYESLASLKNILLTSFLIPIGFLIVEYFFN